MANQNTSRVTQIAETIPLSLKNLGDGMQVVPQWLDELRTKGWTVARETLPEQKALSYADRMYDWLEAWGLGYDRQDKSTHKAENLPFHHRGGIYARYGIAHEQFVWDLKTESQIIEKFETIWGTNRLMVSYDGVNMSIPAVDRSTTDPVFVPWPHVDQSPFRTNLQCVQGILNLLPNGPNDGGLMVLEGSNSWYSELWRHFDHKKGANGWNKWEQQFVDQEMCDWLLEKGCKWNKVCAQPGDLLLWDSRTIHYGAVPSSTSDRFAAYVCYKPASLVDKKTQQKRLEAFRKRENTAHDPAVIRVQPRLPPDDHKTYQAAVQRPLQEPHLSKRGRQLVGLEPYHE